MQIVVLDGYSVNPGDLSWDFLNTYGTVSIYDRTPQNLVAQRILGADVVLTNKCKIGEEELRRADKLKYIGELATGFDGIDCELCSRKGIVVTNIPAYSTPSVAQHEIALLLEIALNVGHHSREVQRGRWTHCADFCFWDTPLLELNGLTFGVIGCGRTGCASARIASSLGMNVIGYSRTIHEEFPGEQVSLDTLIRESDVLSLHCPSTTETKGLVNASFISRMKSGAILLNTARGNIIDPVAVSDALNSGKLYAYGGDVAVKEPIDRHDPLLSAKNCYLTPHNAWATYSARKRLISIAQQNIASFFSGSPINQVNK